MTENTFSVFHFLVGFHVFVMAPSRKWIGFLAAALESPLSSGCDGSGCCSIDFALTTDDAMLLASAADWK